MTDTNKEREAFEAWAAKEWPTLRLHRNEDGDGYSSCLAQEWWQAWLARASLSAEAEPVAFCQVDDSNAAEAFSWPGTNRKPHHNTPLYLAAPAQAPAPGWVSVDIDLIRDVLDSLDDYRMGLEFSQYDRERISRLRALLPAAPSSGKE